MKFSEFKNLVPNGSIELVNNAIVVNANKLLGKNVTWDTDIESLLFYCLHKLSKGVNKRVNFTYGFPIVENGEVWVYSQVGFTVRLPARFGNRAEEAPENTLPPSEDNSIWQRQRLYPPETMVSNPFSLLGDGSLVFGLVSLSVLGFINYSDRNIPIQLWEPDTIRPTKPTAYVPKYNNNPTLLKNETTFPVNLTIDDPPLFSVQLFLRDGQLQYRFST